MLWVYDMFFIMLRFVHFMPAFWRIFIINGCWILRKAFCASFEIIMWFLSFNLFIWCIIFIDLWILMNSCIPGIKPSWSWCMIFLICCWILFARIWLRIFHLCLSVILACSSVLEGYTLLRICPFLPSCPFYWHIVADSSLLWSFVFLCCPLWFLHFHF